MNITELIKDDYILSNYTFEIVYVIIRRLKDLGYLCEWKENEQQQ